MIRPRFLPTWLILCLALLLPITSIGESGGDLAAREGPRPPVSSQEPAHAPEHEEDEAAAGLRLEVPKALGRRLRFPGRIGRITRTADRPAELKDPHLTGWRRLAAQPMPRVAFLATSLTHRGPPSA